MKHHAFRSGVFALLALACSSSPSPAVASPPIDAGDSGSSDYPLLPHDCDEPLPVLSTGSGLRALKRIRVLDGVVYFPHDDGIYATKISGGSPALVMSYPSIESRPDAARGRTWFSDFWIDHEVIVGALGGALFTAPLTGGPPTLVPGYGLPSAEELYADSESYVRAGPYIYATSQLSTGGRGIQRHALSAGPPSDFVRFNDPYKRIQFLVASGESIHYVDNAEPGSSRSAIFVTNLHDAMPMVVPAELRAPAIVGFDANLYVLEGGHELWRLAGDGTWTKLKLPSYAAVRPVPETRYASIGGTSYFSGAAIYRLPDDLRTGRRDVILRVGAGSDTVEIARCLPEASIDPTTPRADLSTEILDLAVDSDALYVVSSTLDAQKKYWKDHILQVNP
jgi:hypothetical protein